MGMGVYHYTAAMGACGGSYILGLSLGWRVSFMLFREKYTFPVSSEEFNWVGLFFTMGATIACIPTGWLSEWIGRKATMMFMAIPFAVGWAVLTFGNSVFGLYVGRLLSGIASGAYCVVTPFYVGEISKTETRGRLCSVQQFMFTSGILTSYVIGSQWCLYSSNVFSCFCCVVNGLLLLWLPESPVYLVSKNKLPQAERSLKWLNREESYNPNEDIKSIQHGLTEDLGCCSMMSFAFKDPATCRAMLITVGLMIFQQFCGYNSIIFDAPDIFEGVAPNIDAKTSTLTLGVLNFIGAVVSYNLIDQTGRMFLLLLSMGVQICSTIGMMVFFAVKEIRPDISKDMVLLPMLSLGGLVFFFGCGLGPVPWVLCGELFSTRTKGYVGTLAPTANWLCAFLVMKSFPYLMLVSGEGGVFAIYAFSSLLGVVFVIFFVIETKGQSLNEIQEMLID